MVEPDAFAASHGLDMSTPAVFDLSGPVVHAMRRAEGMVHA
jgi:hypothetical protein